MPRDLLFAFLLLCCLLGACDQAPAGPTRYVDEKYRFSFVPPPGWTLVTRATPDCLTSVEATQGACRLYVCVSERPEEFLPTTSDFANCELVKVYVAEKLKGFNIRCRPSLIGGRRVYDAIYLRKVEDEAGGVRLQLVRQSFLARGRLLYTLTSYVFGDSAQALKDASSPCDTAIVRSQATFFLHSPPAAQTPR
jgi:hypothetical protein